MRKWTYLVAALLMGGVSTSLTSCIDNDEPYGIEQMRTAKAEFYAAQAAYKTAEIEYLNAQTQLQQYLAEEQNLRNETLKLQNDLQSARNEDEKARLALALEEANAAHAVAMKNYETKLTEAEAAYQTALKKLDIVVSRLNQEYRQEYARILASITANRSRHSQLAANLIKAKLDLAEYSKTTLDTATVRGNMVSNIKRYTKELDMLKAEKGYLTTINNADEGEKQQLIADLDKEIRQKVDEFNVKVANLNKLNGDVTTLEAERSNKISQLRGENEKLYVADKSATISVDKTIQHDFIANYVKTQSGENDLYTTENLNPGTSYNCDYYSLKDAEGKYSKESTDEGNLDQDNDGTIQVDESTTQVLISSLNQIAEKINQQLKQLNGKINNKYNTDWSTDDWDKLEYDKTSKDNKYTEAEKAFTAAWEAFSKEGAIMDTYKKAKDAYGYNEMNPENSTAFKATKDLIDVNWPNSMNYADEAAQKEALGKILKDLYTYAKLRVALDGWAFSLSPDVAPLYTENLDAAGFIKKATDNGFSISQLLNKMLGNEYLNYDPSGKPGYKDAKNYNSYAYGAYKQAVKELFGEYSNWNGFAKPDVTTEYNRNKADQSYNISNWGGKFSAYLTAYQAVQYYKEAEAWKGLNEQIIKLEDPMLADIVKWTVLDATIEKNADVIALQEKINDLNSQISDIKNEIGENAVAIAVKAVTSDIDGNNETDDRVSSISIINADENGNPATLNGTDGSYITTLVSYHNALRGGDYQFNEQLAAIDEAITTKEAELVEEQQLLAQFDNGGWEIKDNNGNPKDVTVTIDQANTDTYTTYTLGTATTGEKFIYKETITWVNGEQQIVKETIPVSEAPDFAAALEEAEGSSINVGNAQDVKVTSSYLKVIIEAYEGKIERIENEMKDVDAELSILQKEQEQFLAKVEARYNAGGNPEETPAE